MAVGINQLFEHSVAGSVYAAFDNATGGGMSYEGGEIKEEEGTGGQVVEYRDMVVPTGNVTTSLQTTNLLACIKPASVGALPPIIEKIQHGVVATANAGRLQEDCYLKTVKLSCAKGGIITAEYSWLALLETKNTTIASAAAKQTGACFPWHDQDPQFDAAGLKCVSWEVTVETGIVADTSQDLKTSGVQRLPEEMNPGGFQCTFSARVKTPRAYDFTVDVPETIGFAVTSTNADNKTFTLTMTGGSKIRLNGDPLELGKGTDTVLYQIDGKTKLHDLDAFVCAIT